MQLPFRLIHPDCHKSVGLQGKVSTSFFSYVKTLSIGSARGLACFRLFHRLLVVLVVDTVECFEKESGGERKRGRKEKGLSPCCFFPSHFPFLRPHYLNAWSRVRRIKLQNLPLYKPMISPLRYPVWSNKIKIFVGRFQYDVLSYFNDTDWSSQHFILHKQNLIRFKK